MVICLRDADQFRSLIYFEKMTVNRIPVVVEIDILLVPVQMMMHVILQMLQLLGCIGFGHLIGVVLTKGFTEFYLKDFLG